MPQRTLRQRSESAEFEAYSNRVHRGLADEGAVPAGRRAPQVPARGGPAHGDGRHRAACCPIAACRPWRRTRARSEKKDLKVGFIPITCATPLIMAAPAGLLREAGPQRRAGQDGRLGADPRQDAQQGVRRHALPVADAAGHPLGLGSNAHADARGHHPEHQRPGDHAGHQAQGQARPEEVEGLQVRRALRVLDAQLPAALLRGRSTASNPDNDIQIRVVPPPEMVANLRAGNIDGYLGPDPFNQRAVYDEVGFIHILTKEMWDGHPCCAFGTSAEFIQKNPNTLRRAVPRGAHRRGDGAQGREPRADRQGRSRRRPT